jgi:hypothetical protein
MRLLDHAGPFDAWVDVGIKLTAAERETLRRASRIGERMRALARTVGADFESHDLDTVFAEIEHACAEVADPGYVVVKDGRD